MRKLKSFFLVGTLCLIALTPLASAQSSKGILVGDVTDQTGAVIGGATIKITNTATNVSRETVSSDAGRYRLDAVDPGLYKIEVGANGFKTSEAENILVAAGQTTNLQMKLEVGSQTDVIQVTAESTVVLQTQDGSRTNTIDARQITDLPVASLNPVALVFTLPGVVDPGPLAGGFAQGVGFSSNGLRERSNNQLIDGTDNNDNSITGQSIRPFMRDAYQEVSVLGGDNSAEYGSGGGSVVNLVTKGGTNQYHGSVYDIITPSFTYALSSGQKVNQGLKSVPVDITNQPGGSIGGPILKDKLFFFATFQATRFRAGSTPTSAVVPTADGFALLRTLFPAGRSANLDRYLAIIGDLRGTTNVRAIPLGGNRPNVNFGVATSNPSSAFNDEQVLGRVDWAATANDSLTFRYILQQQTVPNQIPSAFAGYGIDVTGRNNNFFFNHTHTFSPALTNEFRFSYGRSTPFFNPQDDSILGDPNVTIGGTTITAVGLNANFPQGRVFNNYQYQDTLTYVLGNHTIRAGADLLRQLAKQVIPFNNRGGLAFSAGGGFPGFGNFVDGFSGTQGVFGTRSFGDPVVFPNAFRQFYFVNDSWRVKPNLTLTLGLRYENYGTPFNVVKFPAWPGFDQPFDAVVNQKRDDNNFAPRFSFAYTPKIWKRLFGEDKTVIRGGYGISYDLFFNNILINTAATSPNVFGVTTVGSSVGGRGFANAGFNSLPATGSPNPFAGINSIDRNLVNPLTHTWNIGVQREIFNNIIVDVAYVGTRGTRLFMNEVPNFGVNNVRINPTRGPITVRANAADSIYHGLQTRVERGFKNGVFVRFAYTYSKAIDNNSEVFVTTGGTSQQSNFLDRNADRAPAGFDATHRGVWSFVWDIPGPKSGVLGQVAGGWTVSGTYRLQTGAVETPYLNGLDINRDLNPFNDRPAIGNANAPANSVAILASLFGIPGGGYVDANGFPINAANARYIVDPARRSNLAGRNSIRADKINFGDFSVAKSFKMPWEGHRLELRFELFNVFNTPNYTWDLSVSDGDVFNPNFNNVRLNDGGINTNGNRNGRFQIRYAF